MRIGGAVLVLLAMIWSTASASAAPPVPQFGAHAMQDLAAGLVQNVHARRKYHCHKSTRRSCYWTRGRKGRVRVCEPMTVEECHGGYSSVRRGRTRVITVNS